MLPQNRWFIEYFGSTEAHMHGIKEYLLSKQTQFQRVDLVETFGYGCCLFLDGKIQSSEKDEFIYHEALVHPPLLLIPKPRKVMIIGGAEGATLREVLKHKTIEKAVMVDIDEELVNFCKKFLPEWAKSSFDDPRSEVIYTDARKYLEETEESFDSIIIDLTEPMAGSPAVKLYTKEFYQIVYQHLTPQGTISLQAGTTRPGDTTLLMMIAKTIETSFPIVRIYEVIIPSFDLPWGMILGSKANDPKNLFCQEIDRLLKEREIQDLLYYDGETHQAIFSLPKFLREAQKKPSRLIEDAHPLTIN